MQFSHSHIGTDVPQGAFTDAEPPYTRWSNPLLRRRNIPGFSKIERIMASFSPFEKLAMYVLSAALLASVVYLIVLFNQHTMTEVPAYGGSFTEGIVGTPRFVNPILAISDADRDVAQLVYSGLVRATPEGEIIPDIAERYEISEDGKTYTFVLREDAMFHDGTPLTSADVAFTVRAAQNPDLKSPKRANWEGVTVNEIDERTVQFTLPQPYAPFLENAMLGILPASKWEDVTAEQFPFHQLNTNPIGSGPYRIARTETDDTGAPVSYELRAFKHFALGEPYLTEINLRFYDTENALLHAFDQREVDSVAGVSSASVASLSRNDSTVARTALPRVFAVFFNQNQAPILLSSAVREALTTAIDTQAIIDTVLHGYATPVDGPLPPHVVRSSTAAPATGEDTATTTDVATDTDVSQQAVTQDRIASAVAILEDDGWERNEETGFWEKGGSTLAFSLTTADMPELIQTAERITAEWRKLGADVSLEIFSTASINTNVIRPRNYDALLFGEIVGRTLDLFAFWHSTQRNDPGLNLALYTNTKADKLLSDARGETDRAAREADYLEFAEIVKEDYPAVFLYAPDFIYLVPNRLGGVRLGALTTPSERYLNVHEWHRETENVWHLFTQI